MRDQAKIDQLVELAASAVRRRAAMQDLAEIVVDIRREFDDLAGRSQDYRDTVALIYAKAGMPPNSSDGSLHSALRYHIGKRLREVCSPDMLVAAGLNPILQSKRNRVREDKGLPSEEPAAPDDVAAESDSLVALTAALRRFADERDWAQFHTPKNLVMALVGEAGELVEHFQWLTPEQSFEVVAVDSGSERVSEELADVLIYLVRLADVLGIDLIAAANRKLAANAKRYPSERFRGSAAKAPHLAESGGEST